MISNIFQKKSNNMGNDWRFPNNNYGQENGLDTSDMETFKKDPEASLAREICQNSIDAADSNKKVIVEFKTFKIDSSSIPGYEKLTKEINECYNFKKDSAKEKNALKNIKNYIEKDYITCLRISDFNTTGISGAKSNSRETPFFNLTKGSGVSNKAIGSGGSKGIGKFASFVVSSTNTVFYSTKAKESDGSVSNAHIGISKLRSRPIDNGDELLTMGIGYYSSNEKNHPILNELHLDPNFKRNEHQFGTDIFLIGFDDKKNWENIIISKILDSFMVAIFRDKLEVIVGNYVVNSANLQNLIFNDSVIDEKDYKLIRAQYELLSQEDDSITVEEIEVSENSKVTLYVKQYNSKNESIAPKKCTMVRYPYMKIKDLFPRTFMVPYSALCIIENNELNEKLRAIENPQHTDWEINRLDEFPQESKLTKKLKRTLEKNIKEKIREIISKTSTDSTDMEGAGEFLPSTSEIDFESGDLKNIYKETLTVTKVKRNSVKKNKIEEIPVSDKPKDDNPYTTVDFPGDGESSTPPRGGNGEHGGNGGKRGNSNGSGNGNEKNIPSENNSNGNDHSKKVILSGMTYKTIVTNPDEGKYDCIFTSKYSKNNCYFEIKMLGSEKDKYKIGVTSASINGKECEVENGEIIHFNIRKGKTYKVSLVLDSKKTFASEVNMYANKK